MFNVIFVTENISDILKNNIKILNDDDIECNVYVLNYSDTILPDILDVTVLNIHGDMYEIINELLLKIDGDIVMFENGIGINKHFLTTLTSNYDPNVLNIFRVDVIDNTISIDTRIGKNIINNISLNIAFSTELIQEIYPSDDLLKILKFYYIDIVFKYNIRVFRHIIKGKPGTIFNKQYITKPSKRMSCLKNMSIRQQEKVVIRDQLKEIDGFDKKGVTYTIIIPFMYNGDRFSIFESCLKNLYDIIKDISCIQIAVHETSPKQYITDIFIKKYNLKYIYTKRTGVFDIARNYNYFCKNHIDSDVFVFFDADLIIDESWILSLLNSDSKKCYIGWGVIKYLSKLGSINYINGTRRIDMVNTINIIKYTKHINTGGINIIPNDIFFDVKGWPEDYSGLGYGCIDHSMVWKLSKLYGIYNLNDIIYHLKHNHKTIRKDQRFTIRDTHKKYNKYEWISYIDNIDKWGEYEND